MGNAMQKLYEETIMGVAFCRVCQGSGKVPARGRRWWQFKKDTCLHCGGVGRELPPCNASLDGAQCSLTSWEHGKKYDKYPHWHKDAAGKLQKGWWDDVPGAKPHFKGIPTITPKCVHEEKTFGVCTREECQIEPTPQQLMEGLRTWAADMKRFPMVPAYAYRVADAMQTLIDKAKEQGQNACEMFDEAKRAQAAEREAEKKERQRVAAFVRQYGVDCGQPTFETMDNLAEAIENDCKWGDKVFRPKLEEYDGLKEWLGGGERGLSSNAIVQQITGLQTIQMYTVLECYPRDREDIRRCVELLMAVPSLRPHLDKMRKYSEEWSAAVDTIQQELQKRQ